MKLLDYYKELLDIKDIPLFLTRYLEVPSLCRLKNVGYFCGMDYASKDIYDFSEYITRYDHSLTTCLLTWKLTNDKKATLAALFHDVATPCFSHVIDYMHKDYATQESTEEYTKFLIEGDKELLSLLEEDGLTVDDIASFKSYSVVDNDRPKLCADRLDGIILTGYGWTKEVDKKFILDVLSNISLFSDVDGNQEIGFLDYDVANRVLVVSDNIDIVCHSMEDNYMMELLAHIVSIALQYEIITNDDLYILSEEEILNRFSESLVLKDLMNKFKFIKKSEIEVIDLPYIKRRDLNPLVLGKRIKTN